MEDRDEKEEDREVISNMKTYHMEWSEARDKKITGLVIDRRGDKHWYLNGIWHRENGPACEWADGYKAWYLNDKRLTEQEWKIRMRKKKIGKLLAI